jgi:4-carboxymuconolactone decarboxylase
LTPHNIITGSHEMSEAREKGQAIFAEIYGADMAAGMQAHIASGTFGADVARYANDFAFGEIWARDGIERKMRSCAVLGMVIALRQFDEIGYHVKMGLKNGLTRAELEEVLITAIPYCGIPATQTAKAAMTKALAEVDAAG